MEFGAGTAHLFPSDETVQNLLSSDDPSPIVMVNCAATALEAVGGAFIYRGPVQGNIIGSSGWDVITLNRFPSRRAFAQMMLSAEYQEAAPYRGAALERAELIMTTPALLKLGPA